MWIALCRFCAKSSRGSQREAGLTYVKSKRRRVGQGAWYSPSGKRRAGRAATHRQPSGNNHGGSRRESPWRDAYDADPPLTSAACNDIFVVTYEAAFLRWTWDPDKA